MLVHAWWRDVSARITQRLLALGGNSLGLLQVELEGRDLVLLRDLRTPTQRVRACHLGYISAM